MKLRGYCIIALLAASSPAQQQTPPNSNQAREQASPSQPLTPSNTAPSGPTVPLTVQAPDPETQPAEPEYGGPAILSRGGTASLRTPSENVKIRPYLNVIGSYDSGITPVILNSKGDILNEGSYGVDAEFGLTGYHRWKSATLGLDYKGVYRDYTSNSYYNGTDQTLSLIYQKQATRHWAYTLRETAGVLNRSLFYYGPYDFVDPSFAHAPTQDVFDGRTIYLNTMGDLTYRKSARLSFNFGGDGFDTRRRSTALYGVTGYRARGDVAYRTSRTATTGAAYDFTHFEYTKGFGGSDIHTLSLTQSFRIGRYWELALKAGGARVETLGIQRVTIDPVIAAIIGRSTGIQVVYLTNWVPAVNVVLTRSLRHGSINGVYERGVTPGNGLFLTSRSENVTGSVSYTGIRRLNAGISGGHNTLGTLTVQLGNYSAWTGGAGLTYRVKGPLNVTCRYDYRRYDVTQTIFKRDTYRASIGIAFSPRDVPLTLW